MENFIKELIALDRKARDTVAMAEKASDDAKVQIGRDKEQLYQQQLTEAQRVVEEKAQAAQEAAARQLQKAEAAYREASDQLAAQVQAHQEEWVRAIVENCKQSNSAQ